jgi:hypothetical protein
VAGPAAVAEWAGNPDRTAAAFGPDGAFAATIARIPAGAAETGAVARV